MKRPSLLPFVVIALVLVLGTWKLWAGSPRRSPVALPAPVAVAVPGTTDSPIAGPDKPLPTLATATSAGDRTIALFSMLADVGEAHRREDCPQLAAAFDKVMTANVKLMRESRAFGATMSMDEGRRFEESYGPRFQAQKTKYHAAASRCATDADVGKLTVKFGL